MEEVRRIAGLVILATLLVTLLSIEPAQGSGSQGGCPDGFTQINHSGTLEWTADQDYETVILVGGPPGDNNQDPDGRFKTFHDVEAGETVAREAHEISHVCVKVGEATTTSSSSTTTTEATTSSTTTTPEAPSTTTPPTSNPPSSSTTTTEPPSTTTSTTVSETTSTTTPATPTTVPGSTTPSTVPTELPVTGVDAGVLMFAGVALIVGVGLLAIVRYWSGPR